MASRRRSHPQAAAAGPQPPHPLLPCRSSNPCSSAEDRHDHLTASTGKSSWLGRARARALRGEGGLGNESSQGLSPEAQMRCDGLRHWMILQCEIAFGQIGNGTLCSLTSANVPQHLLPKNSPKRSREPSASELNYWNRWRSLGDSNPCFRRERANKPACRLS
jgi:hypothetical protein